MKKLEEKIETLTDWSLNHPSRRTVFIPVVAKTAQPTSNGTTDAELLKIYAQSIHTIKGESNYEKKAREKDWPVTAIPLRQTGSALFQAACASISAVRALSVKKPKFAFYQYVKPQAWLNSLRLYAVGHRGPGEGGSAQLGLALVLLMTATRTRSQNVIATGLLSTQCNRLYDVKVCSVGKIQEKFQLVLQQAKTKQLALPLGRDQPVLLFFTPVECTIDGSTIKVASLPEVQALNKYKIKVEPVEWLSDAAKILAAHTIRYHIYDHLYQLLLVTVSVIAIVTSTWLSWIHAELPMAFLAADESNQIAEPFSSCFTQDGQYTPMALQKNGIIASIPSQSTLGWKLRINYGSSFDAKLVNLFNYDGYYIAMVLLSEFSPTKVIIPTRENSNEPLRFKPGITMQWGWKLNSKAEANRLMILSQRHRPFNAHQLYSEILNNFPLAAEAINKNIALDITAAGNHLASKYTGSLSFQFLTTDESSLCPTLN